MLYYYNYYYCQLVCIKVTDSWAKIKIPWLVYFVVLAFIMCLSLPGEPSWNVINNKLYWHRYKDNFHFVLRDICPICFCIRLAYSIFRTQMFTTPSILSGSSLLQYYSNYLYIYIYIYIWTDMSIYIYCWM